MERLTPRSVQRRRDIGTIITDGRKAKFFVYRAIKTVVIFHRATNYERFIKMRDLVPFLFPESMQNDTFKKIGLVLKFGFRYIWHHS